MPPLEGNKVSLRRATLGDRMQVYQWLANSDLTARTLGVPVFVDCPVPSYENFCETWLPYYFDGTQPFDGRGFLIRAENEDVGFLAHGEIHIEYPDGCVIEHKAPQIVSIEPGHDGWVVGKEPVVLIEFDFEGDTVNRLGMADGHKHQK